MNSLKTIIKKIKKQKCYDHSDDRDISEYYFWVTDIRKRVHVDIYECKLCKDQLDRDIEREEKIREHNKKQREDADKLYYLKREPKKKERERSLKEDFWDFQVRNELAKGIKLKGNQKYLYKQSIPKEVLQLKRAIMKLERLINSKSPKALKEKYRELTELKAREIEAQKIKDLEELEIKNRPLKKCFTHGNLFLPDLIKSGINRWTGGQAYKCRQCMKKYHQKHYKNNRDKVLEATKNYKEKNNISKKLMLLDECVKQYIVMGKVLENSDIPQEMFNHLSRLKKIISI